MYKIDFNHPVSIYFVGIGGISMSGLAEILHQAGFQVSGSDWHTSAITKHLGITLLPQAGVALGMAMTASNLADGAMVRNVVLLSVLVYELVGPTLTKHSLIAAGEIKPEGRTSARNKNQPKAGFKITKH